MDSTAEQIIAPELQSGERLIWAGQPRRGFLFSLADLYKVPLTVAVCGFWAIMPDDPDDRALAFLLILTVGSIAVGSLLFDRHRRSKTYYGLTSERVVIVVTRRRRILKSIDLRRLSISILTLKSTGRGLIRLGAASPGESRYRWQIFQWGLGQAGAPWNQGLEDLADIRQVYDQIRAVMTVNE